MRRYLLIASVVGLALLGCGKKEEAKQGPASQKQPAVSAESLLGQPAGDPAASTEAAPPAAPTAEATPAAPAGDKMPEPINVYAATRKFFEDQGRAATDLNELVSKGYLKLPPPPAGKKYVLNQRAAMLNIVDK